MAGACPPPVRVLFVCLGNICRSPTAEGVMRALVDEQGLAERIKLDSAGTGAWHIGSPPDARARQAARARGITLEGTARQVRVTDFKIFNILVAMDSENRRELTRLAPGEQERAKVRLLREFDPVSAGAGELDVPDPYYGGDDGFEHVLDLLDVACAGLLAEVQRELARSGESPHGV